MTEDFIYEGADLEAMDFADNYHRWVLGYFDRYLGAAVVEVGAGIGSFSRLLAERTAPQRLLMIEPSPETAKSLAHNAAGLAVPATPFTGFLSEAEDLITEFGPDCFVYVNVFEHVEHDAEEMCRIYNLLPSGGTLCAFVPALPFLYSRFDRSIDHFRRYTKRELREKAAAAGFRVEVIRYFDVVGILPWLIKFRLLGSTTLDTRSVKLFDRAVVPVMSRIENFAQPPIGKNLLMVARKP
ncbi:MAG: methyltransferase domain-containing protein [Solirubrobacterales bacterium]